MLYWFLLPPALLFAAARVARARALHTWPAVPPAEPGTIRVACVGDSITFGAVLLDRERSCYPARLQGLLGARYAVRNFGANGRAYQEDADLPYWDHEYFRLSSAFAPEIVLIMLGTNDSRRPNRRGLEAWRRDCRELLMHYRDLPCRPRVYVLTPPPIFPEQFKRILFFDMDASAVVQMAGAIRELAQELQIELIDVHAALSGRSDFFKFDGVHPGAAGANQIAETVYAALRS